VTSQNTRTGTPITSPLFAVVWLVLVSLPLSTALGDDCSSGGCHQALAPPTASVADSKQADGPTWADPEKHLHGPLADQQCRACHLGHGKGEKPASVVRGTLPTGLYTTYSRSAYSACFDSCHSAALVEDAKTTAATRFRNGDDNLHYRHVAKLRRGRSCRLCHEPHAAENQALIRDYLPFGVQRLTLKYEESDSGGKCTTSCHIPVSYSRDEAILSPMRVAEPSSAKELP